MGKKYFAKHHCLLEETMPMLYKMPMQRAALNYTANTNSGRKTNCINDQMTCRDPRSVKKIKIFKAVLFCAIFCITFSLHASVFTSSVSVPFSLFAYSLFFSDASLSIHPSCGRLFEVSELPVLVISGCHHKKGYVP
ncbi:hypothetical protein ILYODFUR_032355 [Ilyodon furcidens]|uniref:Transmembrane protein n=1 Tax=Ilyodon furcidens TaxID=33524 RepID=A0ABV0UKV8_9TELE